MVSARRPPAGRMRRTAAILAATGLAVVVAACAPVPAPAPEPETDVTTVTIGIEGELTSFNPSTAAGATPANEAVADYLHESFAYLDDDLAVVGNGGLGEVERLSDDPLTVQYTLFRDRRWSDGTRVTLDDLLFGWAVSSGWFDDAAYGPDGQIVSGTRYFDTAASSDGVRDTRRPEVDRGEGTITLVYDEPFADWNREWLLDRPVRAVAERAGVTVAELMAVIREHPRGDPTAPVEPDPVLLAAAAAWNTGFDVDVDAGVEPDLADAVSNGPLRAVSASQDELVLERDPGYVGNHQPAFDRVVLRFYPDDAALRSAVATGEVDVANVGDPTPAEAARLATETVTVLTGPRPQTLGLVFVDEADRMDDDLREALLLSLDRERIVDESVRGVNPDATPLQSFLVSAAQPEAYAQVVADNGAPPPGGDPARAEELLGGRTPTVRIRYEPTDVLSADLFAEIAGMAQVVGISVRPAGDDEPADAALVATDVDASPYRVASGIVVDGAGGATATRALRAMRTTTDPEEVLEHAQDVDRALYSSLYGLPLVERAGAVAHRDTVSGVGYTGATEHAPRYFWTWTPAQG